MALDGIRGPGQDHTGQGDDLQHGERGRAGCGLAHQHGLQLLSPAHPPPWRPAVRVPVQGLATGGPTNLSINRCL